MIASIKSKELVEIINGGTPRRMQTTLVQAIRIRLAMIDAAIVIEDLRVPPSNMLESLRGDRKGQWSIRVNKQYRLCFRWTEAGAEDLEFIDYH